MQPVLLVGTVSRQLDWKRGVRATAPVWSKPLEQEMLCVAVGRRNISPESKGGDVYDARYVIAAMHVYGLSTSVGLL